MCRALLCTLAGIVLVVTAGCSDSGGPDAPIAYDVSADAVGIDCTATACDMDLVGVVEDAQGEPIQGARVFLYTSSSNAPGWASSFNTSSNAAGVYSLPYGYPRVSGMTFRAAVCAGTARREPDAKCPVLTFIVQ